MDSEQTTVPKAPLNSQAKQFEQFEQFEQFDWENPEFHAGLAKITETQGNEPEVLLNAKIFYYKVKTGIELNAAEYQAWAAEKSRRSSAEPSAEPSADPSVQSTLSESHPTFSDQPSSEAPSSDPPYSQNYQRVVEMILRGENIPVKQIPNIVLKNQSSASTAKPRRKPWETDKEEEPKEAEEIRGEEAEMKGEEAKGEEAKETE